PIPTKSSRRAASTRSPGRAPIAEPPGHPSARVCPRTPPRRARSPSRPPIRIRSISRRRSASSRRRPAALEEASRGPQRGCFHPTPTRRLAPRRAMETDEACGGEIGGYHASSVGLDHLDEHTVEALGDVRAGGAGLTGANGDAHHEADAILALHADAGTPRLV